MRGTENPQVAATGTWSEAAAPTPGGRLARAPSGPRSVRPELGLGFGVGGADERTDLDDLPIAYPVEV